MKDAQKELEVAYNLLMLAGARASQVAATLAAGCRRSDDGPSLAMWNCVLGLVADFQAGKIDPSILWRRFARRPRMFHPSYELAVQPAKA
jgi:hypothetical protein